MFVPPTTTDNISGGVQWIFFFKLHSVNKLLYFLASSPVIQRKSQRLPYD